MNQASRGWFSSGSISVANNRDRDDDSKDESYDSKKQHATTQTVQLSDDDMFISTADQSTSEDSPMRRKYLVENIDMFRKKR